MTPSNCHLRRQDGSVTLLTVFLTGMIALLLVFADNTRAVKEGALAQSDAATEQAFFASQSCLEEGYLQLRFHDNYHSPYDTSHPLTVGTSNCMLVQVPGETATSGSLVAEGSARNIVRTVVSSYRDAGPTESRNDTSIFHVLDRSGSMGDDGEGCSDSTYTVQSECEDGHDALWGPRPLVNVKAAATLFLKSLKPSHDKIGLVSYNGSASLDADINSSYATVETKIAAMAHGGYTNIGEAIQTAADALQHEPASRSRIAIVLTDGQPTAGPPGIDPAQFARDMAQDARDNKGIIIITIGLGSAASNPTSALLLQDLASVIGTRTMYYPAPNASDLASIYQQIANVLTSFDIKQGSWTEQ